MMADRTAQAELLVAIWWVSTKVSLPVGGDFLERGVRNAASLLPAALSELATAEDSSSLAEVVSRAQDDGILRVHDDGHLRYGIIEMDDVGSAKILASHGLTRADGHRIGRKMFEGCTGGTSSVAVRTG